MESAADPFAANRKYVDRFASLASQQQAYRRKHGSYGGQPQVFGVNSSNNTPYGADNPLMNSAAFSMPSQRSVNNDVPFADALETKVVSKRAFDRMAKEKAAEGGIIEKTIFVLKPIIVPAAVQPEPPKHHKLKFRKSKER